MEGIDLDNSKLGFEKCGISEHFAKNMDGVR